MDKGLQVAVVFAHSRQCRTERGVFNVYQTQEQGPILLFVHGGGFTGASFTVLAHHFQSAQLATHEHGSGGVGGKVRIVCPDLRAHGETRTPADLDMHLDTLVDDLAAVVDQLTADEESPPLVVCGHSLGGCIAMKFCAEKKYKNIEALVVIDVVEGTALESLHAMTQIIMNRPAQFNSFDAAVRWAVATGYIRNEASARISLASQLCVANNSTSMAKEIKMQPHSMPKPRVLYTISETGATKPQIVLNTDKGIHLQGMDPQGDSKGMEDEKQQQMLCWRTDLLATKPYWAGWFSGRSRDFLSFPGRKLLMLAGTDRLDKTLLVGQMQGDFQLEILPRAGHAIHEDVPEAVSKILGAFIKRHRLLSSCGP